jgi:site-specific DNA-methyltransferase (adenine-specific)
VIDLRFGDCLSIMRSLPDGFASAIITDPPYGTKKAAWDHSIDRDVFSECLRVSNGYCLFFYSNTRLWHILGLLHDLGRDTWVIPWFKPNAMGFERRFAPQWVPIVCAYRGNLPFWGKDLISVPIIPQDVDHPTPKPVKVVEWLIEKATKPGDLVVDPFLGSGTTAIACLNTGRRCFGIENHAPYFATAQRRLASHTPTLFEMA